MKISSALSCPSCSAEACSTVTMRAKRFAKISACQSLLRALRRRSEIDAQPDAAMDRVADRSWAEGSVDEKVHGPAARDAEPAPGDLNASRRHTAPSRSDIRA